MKKVITGLAFAGSLIMGQAAFADGMPQRSLKDAPAPAMSWTGFYVGGSLGWHRVDSGSYVATPLDAATTAFWATTCTAGGSCNPSRGAASGDGAIGGLQAGYNWQSSNFVAGIEVDVMGSTAGATRSNQELNPVLLGASTAWRGIASTNVEWMSTVRGRLGVVLSQTFLAYVTGGLAVAGVERDWSQAFTTNSAVYGSTAGHNRTTQSGWTIGGGAEWALTNRVTLGAEYLFVSLGGQNFGASFVPASISSAANSNFGIRAGDVDNHIARLKVNFKL